MGEGRKEKKKTHTQKVSESQSTSEQEENGSLFFTMSKHLATGNAVKHSLLRPTVPHPEPGSGDKAGIRKRSKSGCLKRNNPSFYIKTEPLCVHSLLHISVFGLLAAI